MNRRFCNICRHRSESGSTQSPEKLSNRLACSLGSLSALLQIQPFNVWGQLRRLLGCNKFTTPFPGIEDGSEKAIESQRNVVCTTPAPYITLPGCRCLARKREDNKQWLQPYSVRQARSFPPQAASLFRWLISCRDLGPGKPRMGDGFLGSPDKTHASCGSPSPGKAHPLDLRATCIEAPPQRPRAHEARILVSRFGCPSQVSGNSRS